MASHTPPPFPPLFTVSTVLRDLGEGGCPSRAGRAHLSHTTGGTGTGLVFSFFLFLLLKATTVAYGGSQPRGRIGAAAAGLQSSHKNARSELCLCPKPWLTAMLAP